jgi:UDP:flavonoid glycosyltransferase YjiC (YdhE family)
VRFILSPVGSAGDVHPYIGLGMALRARGHEVVFLINGYFEELVRRHGFAYQQFGEAKEFLDAAGHPDLWHPRKALALIAKRFIAPYCRKHFDLIAEMHTPGSVVLTSCLGAGALIAQDKLGIPVISVHLQPSVIWSDIAPPELPGTFGPRWLRMLQYRVAEAWLIPRWLGKPINRVRADLQLPPVDHVLQWWHSRGGSLCLFPRWYCPPQADWPQPLLQAGFPLWDDGQEQPLGDDVQRFLDQGEPPIAFTPGSANMFGERFFRESLAACQRLGKRAILLTKFPDQVPAALPDTAAAFAYVPFRQLLPRCAAVVHHGGIGTTAQGIKAGVPQLIMALAHDQYDNGQRIRSLGLGDWLPSRQYRARRVAQRLQSVLDSPEILARAAAVQQQTAADGLADAAQFLEEHLMAQQGPPLTATG